MSEQRRLNFKSVIVWLVSVSILAAPIGYAGPNTKLSHSFPATLLPAEEIQISIDLNSIAIPKQDSAMAGTLKVTGIEVDETNPGSELQVRDFIRKQKELVGESIDTVPPLLTFANTTEKESSFDRNPMWARAFGKVRRVHEKLNDKAIEASVRFENSLTDISSRYLRSVVAVRFTNTFLAAGVAFIYSDKPLVYTIAVATLLGTASMTCSAFYDKYKSYFESPKTEIGRLKRMLTFETFFLLLLIGPSVTVGDIPNYKEITDFLRPVLDPKFFPGAGLTVSFLVNWLSTAALAGAGQGMAEFGIFRMQNKMKSDLMKNGTTSKEAERLSTRSAEIKILIGSFLSNGTAALGVVNPGVLKWAGTALFIIAGVTYYLYARSVTDGNEMSVDANPLQSKCHKLIL